MARRFQRTLASVWRLSDHHPSGCGSSFLLPQVALAGLGVETAWSSHNVSLACSSSLPPQKERLNAGKVWCWRDEIAVLLSFGFLKRGILNFKPSLKRWNEKRVWSVWCGTIFSSAHVLVEAGDHVPFLSFSPLILLRQSFSQNLSWLFETGRWAPGRLLSCPSPSAGQF